MKLSVKAHRTIISIAGIVFSLVMRVVAKTIREKKQGKWPSERPCIYALWHNRQLLAISAHRDKGLCTLASASRDGDYITAILEKLGYTVARGSTDTNKSNYTKSLSAARSLLRMLKAGKSIAVTVDGPLGPKYTVQEGVIFLAKATGCPIMPIAFASSSAMRLKTWDNLEIPLPFSRAAIVYGEEYNVDRNADMASEAEKLRKTLCDMTEQAEKMAA